MDEANNWASRRKSIYLGVSVFVVSAFVFFIFWKFWYTAPTCFDGVRNGGEAEIDCGGACVRICPSDAGRLIVRWDPRLFEVLPGVWSAIVYVQNPNINVDAIYAPYKFVIYGGDNKVLYERKGVTLLPKNKTVGVFEGSISLPLGIKPARTLFELDAANVVWRKGLEEEKSVKITHSPILRLDTAPRVEASVKNETLYKIKNIELVAAIFDGRDNAIAASRTFIDSLKKDESAQVFFTWPRPFELGTRACTRKSDVALLLDRSGSMASVSGEPPEPLTSAKAAATSFVDSLKRGDQVAVISFATEASHPHDLALTSDLNLAREKLTSLSIAKGFTQYTNIYEALHEGWSALTTGERSGDSAKVLILLTDGVANTPRDPDGKTEADDVTYAERAALGEVALMKEDEVEVYTIGLGDEINDNFLAQIASEAGNFFFAPTASDLQSIYKNISSDICEEVPARIEITYKILDV